MDMDHTSFDEEHCFIRHNQFECPSIEVGKKLFNVGNKYNYVSALTENVVNKSLAEDDNDISNYDSDLEAELDDTYDDDAEI